MVKIASYNVENLFDTIDDPNISDENYLPDSKVAWNTKRYFHKLDNMSKVMRNIDTAGFPALFGLCEVENIDVIRDLIKHSNLTDAGYDILHKDSPDGRGIDVALLYKPEVFNPINVRYIILYFPDDPDLKTREELKDFWDTHDLTDYLHELKFVQIIYEPKQPIKNI